MHNAKNTPPPDQAQLAKFADYLRHETDENELQWMISDGADRGVFTFQDIEGFIDEFIPDGDYDDQRCAIEELADFFIYAGTLLAKVVEEAPELTGPLELVQAHANALVKYKKLKAEALQTIQDKPWEHAEKTKGKEVLEAA